MDTATIDPRVLEQHNEPSDQETSLQPVTSDDQPSTEPQQGEETVTGDGNDTASVKHELPEGEEEPAVIKRPRKSAKKTSTSAAGPSNATKTKTIGTSTLKEVNDELNGWLNNRSSSYGKWLKSLVMRLVREELTSKVTTKGGWEHWRKALGQHDAEAERNNEKEPKGGFNDHEIEATLRQGKTRYFSALHDMPLIGRVTTEGKFPEHIKALKERMRLEVNKFAHVVKMERECSFYKELYEALTTDEERHAFIHNSRHAFMPPGDIYQPREKKQEATVVGCKQDGEDEKTFRIAADLKTRLEKSLKRKDKFDDLSSEERRKLRGATPKFRVANHPHTRGLIRALKPFREFYTDSEGEEEEEEDLDDNDSSQEKLGLTLKGDAEAPADEDPF